VPRERNFIAEGDWPILSSKAGGKAAACRLGIRHVATRLAMRRLMGIYYSAIREPDRWFMISAFSLVQMHV